MAHVSLALGEHKQAVSWLEKAAEERDGLLPFINASHTDFRFRPAPRRPPLPALLRRMNFPETAPPT